MLDFLKEEAIAAYGLIVVAAVFFVAALIGQFFGSIGDHLFGDKEEANDPPSESR